MRGDADSLVPDQKSCPQARCVRFTEGVLVFRGCSICRPSTPTLPWP